MNKTQEIERTIIKQCRSKLWAPFIKALKRYDLIQPGDHILVCISGGKDSMLMAKLFQELQRHPDFEFKVSYLVMNPGYNQKTFELIKKNLEILNIPAEIVNSDIFEIANSVTENPCYLCARMRRGVLYNFAKERGCNKISLGHHYDDVIETTLMSILTNGVLETMLPKLHSTNFEGLELIRPLYLIRERDVINWANRNELEFIRCACKFTENHYYNNGGSKRSDTKKLIAQLEKENPNVVKNLFKVTTNVNLNKILGYKKDGVMHNFLDEYENKNE